jgi:hypothetical protein
MAMLHGFHPAAGLGDLLPGMYTVPMNPIRAAQQQTAGIVPSLQATAPGKVIRRQHMGEILAGRWTVPQNPLIRSLTGGGMGCVGCAGVGCVGCAGMSGLGDASTGNFLTDSTIISGVPDGILYGGAALLAWMIFAPGGSEYRKRASALRSQYRGYKRAAAAIS